MPAFVLADSGIGSENASQLFFAHGVLFSSSDKEGMVFLIKKLQRYVQHPVLFVQSESSRQ